MSYTVNSQNQFVIDLLTTLRKEKFSPLGWWHFIRHSWEMSWNTAQAHPTLKRSWARITVFISTLAIAILLISFFLEGPAMTIRLLPGFLFCVAWQQSDLFWHLGLNRQAKTGELLPTVGIANTFTWLRGLAASFLLGRLIGGVSTASWLALLVFMAGIVTDILDGQVARYTRTQSKLGQIADGEADFCLYSAITIILIQNGVLPLWLGLMMLLRFLVPLLAALASYFIFAHPIRFGSTVWGKYAALAQCLYFLVLLAPQQLAFIARFINLPLLIVTLILLVAAPIAQIVENVLAETRRAPTNS
ncbi:MAG TPA: CDP-alcohol phosphatidyltransferase family protein [Ktedonobacteraceae bacterium]|nr:CDP-alcohol phosphatidyltransferase family protein [Ktedonobacteraceae bacterium]